MKKVLFYDTEIANCVPDRFGMQDSRYKFCRNWSDYENMGISCIAAYTNWKKKYYYFVFDQLKDFENLADEADEVVGFNSIHFDDNLLKAYGFRVRTTYDLLCEIRVAAGMPPNYVRGVTRGGYSLEQVAQANLGRGKSGTGELAPQLWQDGKYQEVIQYCLNDVQLLVELWGKRSHLIDPTNDSILFLRGGNRLKWLKAVLAQWLKRTREGWKHSTWRIFCWATTNSDISGCRIQIGTRINNLLHADRSGIIIQIAFPEIYVELPDKIVKEFEEKTGERTGFTDPF